MTTRIVAVVLTFNRRERLGPLLRDLAAHDRRPDHVLVVDNSSTDGTHELLVSLGPKQPVPLTVLRLARNGGSAEGYHVALDWCLRSKQFDWAWLVEDDLVPAADALTLLLEAPEFADPLTTALASAINAPGGGHLLVPRGTLRPRFLDTPCIPIPETAYGDRAVAVEYFGFLGSLVRLDAVRRCGLPRRDMLGWIDDVDFSSRLARGGRAWLIPRSTVLHDDGMPAAEFGSTFVDRLRRLRSEPSISTMWRNAYGLRNLIVWGRAFGLVRRRHAIAYWLMLTARALLAAKDHRRIRARIYTRMAIDGWRGRVVNASPDAWRSVGSWQGPISAFLEDHAMGYEGAPAAAIAEEVSFRD